MDMLHAVARRLIAARTEVDVHHVAVSSLTRLTEADSCELALESDGALEARANVTFGQPDATLASPLAIYRPILERAYETGASGLVDDLSSVRSAALAADVDAGTSYRSLLTVPVADEGLLVAADREPGYFSRVDRASLGHLADYVAAALDRTSAGGPDDSSRRKAVANVISHDVQNALTVANGRLALVLDEVDHEQLSVVDAAHDRLFEMTDDLVTVLRTGDSVTSIEPVDLEREATRAWQAVETADATLTIADSRSFMADESSLCQLLENLYRNAVEHGGADVTVTVGFLAEGGGFYVADDGPGIPEDDREAVFEMGYTTGEDATGYGLAIVNRIADAHAWDVAVTESESGGGRVEVTGVESP